MTGNDAWRREYWARGFRLFAAGVDVHLLQSALRGQIGALRDLSNRG
jgi:hypothetical protein